MSYTPHTWVDNETITAEKLNNIEDGVQEAAQSGGGGMLVHISDGTLDKTFSEIWDALYAGTPVYLTYNYGAITDYESISWTCPITTAYKYNDAYNVMAVRHRSWNVEGPASICFTASSADGYPEYAKTFTPSNTSYDSNMTW